MLNWIQFGAHQPTRMSHLVGMFRLQRLGEPWELLVAITNRPVWETTTEILATSWGFVQDVATITLRTMNPAMAPDTSGEHAARARFTAAAAFAAITEVRATLTAYKLIKQWSAN